MTDPLFWLVLSFLFVTASLTIALVVAIPALKELARAARSADKLFETLRREFPPTLQALRSMGVEVADLSGDVSEGVQSAGNVVKQVDQSLTTVRKQAQKVGSGTRSLLVGVKAAWRTFTKPPKPMAARRPPDRLPPGLPLSEINPNGASPLQETRVTDRAIAQDKLLEPELDGHRVRESGSERRPPEVNHLLPPDSELTSSDMHWTSRTLDS